MASGQESLDRLEGQLGEMEVKIEASVKELKQAVIQNMPHEYTVIIKDEINRLVEEKRDLRRQLYALQLRVCTPEARKSSTTGRESHPSSEMPVSDSEEKKLWIDHVFNKEVPCKAVQPELADWLEEVPEELIAARYLHFLEYEGRACSVEDQVGEFRCMPTRLLEVPCQPMLLPILTAAAGGQPGLTIVPEERTPGDPGKADFCTNVRLLTGDWADVGPGEMKAKLGRCTSWDPTGIHVGANLDSHAKVFQVCWAKLLGYGKEFVCICTATLEALWIVRLSFAKDVPHCATLDTDCKVLERVEITPPFLMHNEGAHPGFIVPSLRKALEKIQYISDPTLTDLVTAPCWGVPPGFRLAVREAATQARMWGLQPVSLMLQPVSGGTAIATSDCSIIAAGRHAIVLRLAEGQDYVIKIAKSDKIKREVQIHSHADNAETDHIRKLYRDLSGAPLIGTVQGAGVGLDFLALDGYFPSTLKPALDSTNRRQAAKHAQQAWSGLNALHDQKVMHRDLKPENILIASNGDLCINDLDVACMSWDTDAKRQKVGNQAYESFKRGQTYEFRDDDLSLGLVLAEVLGIWRPSLVNNKEAALVKLCDREEVPESMRVALKKHLGQ